MRKTGIATEKDLHKILPPEDGLKKGGVVLLECFERIPCDPCVDACPRGVITIDGSINELPKVNFELCNGCGLCISKCPGLAIFVINKYYSENESLVMLPYEFIPLPKKGDIVEGLDRRGKKVCDAKVVRVLNKKAQDRTAIISMAVPRKFVMDVRNIRVTKA